MLFIITLINNKLMLWSSEPPPPPQRRRPIKLIIKLKPYCVYLQENYWSSAMSSPDQLLIKSRRRRLNKTRVESSDQRAWIVKKLVMQIRQQVFVISYRIFKFTIIRCVNKFSLEYCCCDSERLVYLHT